MRLAPFIAALAMAALLAPGLAAQEAKVTVRAAILKVERPRPLPISRLDLPAADEGFAGGRLATADNATTGRFLGHDYETLEVTAKPEEAAAELDALAGQGVGIVVAIAAAEDLLALADHAAGREMLILNAAAPDDRLRVTDCRANVMHVAPSRAMLADGLAQYLVWKKWTDWLLVSGSHPEDRLKAEALKRAAAKFGAKVVEELVFEDTGGARRSDSGHVLVQRQIPVFMQRAREHDVVVVADESQVFGAYIPFRTWEPRPVAGDAGLRARTWHPAHESYGATQLQTRFEKLTHRWMSDLDYQVWLALRAVGEAVTRTNSAELADIRTHLLAPEFQLGGFKGQALSFRPWNHQLRHGILVADERLVVTVSPQDEFLHQHTRLDTLGFDAPETRCAM
ncbi:MAG TPA: ABC transporter substrate-binding protein [Paracoccaceae bacterium]|nr:ABC transporter substrate-binding protein [Paracoccaceae bacterium]